MPDILNLTISGRKEQIEGTIVFDLLPVGGESLPPFDAGAHVDVHVAPGIVRQYSLCNSPAESHRYRIGVLKERQSRGGSAAIHNSFLNGRTIRISRPRNNFPLIEDSGRSILVAGGIGITPLLAMAYRLHDQKKDFALHYCVRSRCRAAFLDELVNAAFENNVCLHCDDGSPEQRFNPKAALIAHDCRTHLYVCGPSGFIDCVIGDAVQIGWPRDRIHVERFQRHVDTNGAGKTFTVVGNRSGIVVQVPPEKTIAAALADVGIDIQLSCEQGVCGTCITSVIEGVPEHRDIYLTGVERTSNSKIAVCCSRSLTDTLVLDI